MCGFVSDSISMTNSVLSYNKLQSYVQKIYGENALDNICISIRIVNLVYIHNYVPQVPLCSVDKFWVFPFSIKPETIVKSPDTLCI